MHMKRRVRVVAWLLTFVMLFSMIPAEIAGAAEQKPATDILKMMYVEPQSMASEAGQLIVAEIADGNGTLTGARLYYRDGSGTEREMNVTEISGNYAAFLVKGGGLADTSLSRIELVCGGVNRNIDLKAYRASGDTAVSKVEGSHGESSKSRAESVQSDADQKAEENTVKRVLADDSAGITNALNQAQALAGAQAPKLRGYSAPRAGSDGQITVVLDPGHGGSESGACRTWNGKAYIEKDITLKISKYTKKELEKYEGVKVYLTRSTDKYMELYQRVDFGASVGATVFISQHINSTNSNEQYSVSGALVFLSKGQYRGDITQASHDIAYTILDKLNAAGFKNQGIQYRLSETGDQYPNGTLADYYGIVRRCVLAGFPGMIVEHGFVNNPNDCVKFYGSNSKIKKIGVADAKAIAAYYGLKKKDSGSSGTNPPPAVDTGWKKDGSNTYYVKQDGSRATGWQTIDGKVYYFNAGGIMLTGKQKISGKIHYFQPSGEAMTGVQTIGGKKVSLDEKGVIIAIPAGSWTLKGSTWYFKKWDGKNATGWITYKGRKCYLNKDGSMVKRWKKIKGKWYYFSGNGYMVTGKRTLGGKTCYFGDNGAALTGKQVINKETVFLNEKGVLLPNRWVKDNVGWWYRYGNGTYPKKKWVTIEGKRYYFNKKGYMETGWIKLGKNWYYLRSDGSAKNGWLKSNGKWYYLVKGKMQTKSWIHYKKKWYYVKSDGVRAVGKRLKIGKKTYKFDANGVCKNKK